MSALMIIIGGTIGAITFYLVSRVRLRSCEELLDETREQAQQVRDERDGALGQCTAPRERLNGEQRSAHEEVIQTRADLAGAPTGVATAQAALKRHCTVSTACVKRPLRWLLRHEVDFFDIAGLTVVHLVGVFTAYQFVVHPVNPAQPESAGWFLAVITIPMASALALDLFSEPGQRDKWASWLRHKAKLLADTLSHRPAFRMARTVNNMLRSKAWALLGLNVLCALIAPPTVLQPAMQTLGTPYDELIILVIYPIYNALLILLAIVI